MGRPLFCRDAAALGAILEALPASQRDTITVRHSPSGGMLFAEVARRG